MSGWTCTDGAIRAAEDFKANESRAGFSTSCARRRRPAPTPARQLLCCFVPALPQPGGSCVSDLNVPDCEENRFGFPRSAATAGTDLRRVTCDGTPTDGINSDGYASSSIAAT